MLEFIGIVVVLSWESATFEPVDFVIFGVDIVVCGVGVVVKHDSNIRNVIGISLTA